MPVADEATAVLSKPGAGARAAGGDPARVGRFAIRRRLGEGGMGVVYVGRDETLERDLALKLVHPEMAGPEARERMLREAKAMAKVAHPNVVAVYEAGMHEGSLYIAMELVPGRSLGDWLDEAPREARAVLGKLVECGRALAAAHRAEILHRDFKPANVLVGEDGRARVLDFGLACPIRGGAAGAEIVGTPAYMAPEQFDGAASDKSDQWSFGVTCYRALFGKLPFDGDGVTALMAAILSGEVPAPPPRPDVPPAVTAAVLRALAQAPDARWPSLDAMVGVLEAELARDPDRDPNRSRRQRRMLAMGVTAFALAAGGVMAGITGLGRTATTTFALTQAILASVTIAVAGFANRRRFADAHGRKVVLWYWIFAAQLVPHRALSLDQPLPDVLRSDAVSCCVLAILGGALLERWMYWIVAVFLAYLAVTYIAPATCFGGFGVAIVGSVALAIWFWRDTPAT